MTETPKMARKYRALAKAREENMSELFRDMFSAWRSKQLKAKFKTLQTYGAARAVFDVPISS